MIERGKLQPEVRKRLETTAAVALIGARQVGKTILAPMILDEGGTGTHYFDLERPADLARLSEPELILGPLQGLVVLDEIQRRR